MAKRYRFTPTCYGIIGVLEERFDFRFPLTEQRIADRMVEAGWLERVEVDAKEKAGTYEYIVKRPGYVATKEGHALWEEMNILIRGKNYEKIPLALRGEKYKERILSKTETKEKLEKLRG